MTKRPIILISGTSRGIGKYFAKYYSKKGFTVIGCSRKPVDYKIRNYHHFCLDITDEQKVKEMFSFIRKKFGRLDVLINNAGIGSMNHSMLIPIKTVQNILNTNVVGTFLLSRESAKLMILNKFGKIINLVSIASSLKLEGEAAYAASKSAILTLTEIMAREYAESGISVNAVGPTPVKTDLIKGVPQKKIEKFLERQVISKFSTPQDICNTVDFFIDKKNSMITGQVLYFGGI